MPEGFKDDLEDPLDLASLVSGEVADRGALERSALTLETDPFLGRHAVSEKGLLSLRATQRLEELVGLYGLMPEDIVRVIGFFVESLSFMGVEDGSPEGDMCGAVAIAAQGHVTTGEDELELATSRFTENGDGLPLAESAHIVLELLVEALVPIGAGHAFKDAPDEGLLILVVEVAGHDGIGDAPVVLDPGAQETPFRIGMIPAKAYGPALFLAQVIMEYLDEGFGW